MKRFMPAAMLCASALAVAACGTAKDNAQTRRDPAVSARPSLSMTLGSYFINPATVTLPTGRVKLSVENASNETHELVIIRTNTPDNRLPVHGHRVAESEAGGNYGEVDNLAARHHRSLNLSLPAGNYVMLCNLAGHYERGMRAQITVL